jgi:hypothetical protein
MPCLFHDLASPEVARLDYFADRGWQTMVYQNQRSWASLARQVQPVHIPTRQWPESTF